MGLPWLKVYRTEALAEQKGNCLYCKEPLPVHLATADHFWPRSRGGPTSRENIKAACYPCNLAKGAWHEARFFKAITGKMPPSRVDLQLIWASRRIWRRTHKACARIERAVSNGER